MFEVSIKTLDGQSRTLQIEDEDLTVAGFKQILSEQMEIPIENQRLIFQGKVLIDDRKLKDSGVESKTIHLVPRPPPSAVDPNAVASSSVGDISEDGQTRTNITGLPWIPFQGIQRAAQNITQGILSGISDLGRPSDLVMRSDNDGNVDIQVSVSVLNLRDNLFRRLHRQATTLLNNAARSEGTLAFQTLETAGDTQAASSSVSVSEEQEMVHDTPEAPDMETGANSPISSLNMTTSPPTPPAPEPQTNSSEAEQSTSSRNDVSFTRIANMLCEQRNLWRQMEPYLDRWETMLKQEQEAQQLPSGSPNAHETPTTESSKDHMETSPMDVETSEQLLPNEDQISSDLIASGSETILEATTPEKPEATVAPAHDWSQRFFNQISGLLHLHAHMLHLLSDFVVGVSVENSTTLNTQVSTANTQPTVPPCGASPPVSEESENTVTGAPSVATVVPTSHPRRIVLVPESEGQIVHARINIEPTTLTFAQPIIATSEVINQPRNEEPSTQVNEIASDERPSRRSQSAQPPLSAGPDADGTTSEAGLSSAFVIEHSTESPSPGVQSQVSSSIYDGLSRDVLRFMEMVPMLTNQRTQPITTTSSSFAAQQSPHVQIFRTGSGSSYPRSSLPLSRSVGNLVETVESGTTAPTTAASTNNSQPATHRGRQRHNARSQFPSFLFPNMSNNSQDPFLPCRSRHFAYLSRGGALQGRRTATPLTSSHRNLRETRSIGRIGRRGRPVDVLSNMFSFEARPVSASSNLIQVSSSPSIQATAQTMGGATISSMTIPIGESFSFGDSLSSLGDQLQNLIAGSLGQTANMFNISQPSARSVSTGISGGGNQVTAVVGPFNWIFNNETTTASTQPIVTQTAEIRSEQLSGDTDLVLLPSILIEGIIRTIWSFIADLAIKQPASSIAPLVENWPSTTRSTLEMARAHFTQSFLTLSHNLQSSGYLSTRTPVSDIHMHNCIDGVRTPLVNMLPADFTAGRDTLRERLSTILLSNQFNDVDEDISAQSATELNCVNWASERAREIKSNLVDIRHSLLAFLVPQIMSQVTMWHHSPTNTGFGSLLMVTLYQALLDLLAYADLLASKTATSLGLQFVQQSDEDSSPSTSSARAQTFGHNMSFSPLLNHLDEFAATFTEDSNDRRVLFLIQTGLQDSLTRYLNLNNSVLMRYATAPVGLISYRLNTDTASSQPVSEVDDVQMDITDDFSLRMKHTKMKNSEDSDASDVYEDANDIVAEVNVPPTTSTESNDVIGFISEQKLYSCNQAKKLKLPLWKPENGEIPASITEALSPNPLSSEISCWDASLDNDDELSSDGLPCQWMQVVNNDVARMSAIHVPPSGESARHIDQVGYDMHYRLSDAYISGMPAKRRKLMLESKAALLCPLQNMFSNILAEAVEATESQGIVRNNGQSLPVPVLVPNVNTPQTLPIPESSSEITGALQNYVSDYLAKRLATDPDFDPIRFPNADKKFAKPHKK